MKDEVLKKEELIKIIKSLVAEQIEAYVRKHEEKMKEFSLLERIIRVEEELKAQREMDKRFESVEKRLLFLQWFMAGGFTLISVLITIINFLK